VFASVIEWLPFERRRVLVSRGRVSPRRATYFSLLRQRNVGKRKATPLSATLRFAAGNLRCSGFAGSRRTRFAQTAASPDPRNPALLGAYRGAWRPNGPLLRSATRPPQARSACGGWCWLLVLSWAVGLGAERERRLPAPTPSVCAEERRCRRDQGRSCLSEASSADPRRSRAPQVSRSAAKGRRQ